MGQRVSQWLEQNLCHPLSPFPQAFHKEFFFLSKTLIYLQKQIIFKLLFLKRSHIHVIWNLRGPKGYKAKAFPIHPDPQAATEAVLCALPEVV